MNQTGVCLAGSRRQARRKAESASPGCGEPASLGFGESAGLAWGGGAGMVTPQIVARRTPPRSRTSDLRQLARRRRRRQRLAEGASTRRPVDQHTLTAQAPDMA
jgi:hypothetical protein